MTDESARLLEIRDSLEFGRSLKDATVSFDGEAWGEVMDDVAYLLTLHDAAQAELASCGNSYAQICQRESIALVDVRRLVEERDQLAAKLKIAESAMTKVVSLAELEGALDETDVRMCIAALTAIRSEG